MGQPKRVRTESLCSLLGQAFNPQAAMGFGTPTTPTFAPLLVRAWPRRLRLGLQALSSSSTKAGGSFLLVRTSPPGNSVEFNLLGLMMFARILFDLETGLPLRARSYAPRSPWPLHPFQKMFAMEETGDMIFTTPTMDGERSTSVSCLIQQPLCPKKLHPMTCGSTTVSSSNPERLMIGLQPTVERQATSQGCWPIHGTGMKASAPSCKQAMSSRNGSFLSQVKMYEFDWPTPHSRNQRWWMTFNYAFDLRTGQSSFPTN